MHMNTKEILYSCFKNYKTLTFSLLLYDEEKRPYCNFLNFCVLSYTRRTIKRDTEIGYMFNISYPEIIIML